MPRAPINRSVRSVAAILAVAAACLAQGGCSQSPAETTDSAEPDRFVGIEPVDRISFSATECFGTCPAFTIVAGESGEGHFEGKAYVAQQGLRDFAISTAQFSAFAERLAPFRPDGEKAYDRGQCVTDLPSVQVTWRNNGKTDLLRWNLGCENPWTPEQERALYRAWELLPVQDLVGSDDQRSTYARRER